MRIDLQTAYVLHTRPYRDTSLLIDFFTPDYGRIGAVARGVRQRKGGKRSLLNPFCRLLVSLQGRRDLKLMTAAEADGPACHLTGRQLYSGFYLNELLIRLLPEMDAHPHIFYAYQTCLTDLQAGHDLEPLLRKFEFGLLQELGYGINFTTDALSGEPLRADQDYYFDPDSGFYRVATGMPLPGALLCAGGAVLAIGDGDFSQAQTRVLAKQVSRVMLKPLLGSRPLKSRELFKTVTS